VRPGDAGVVDQNVETACSRNGLGRDGHGLIVGHVKLHEPAAQSVCRLLTAFRVARSHPDRVVGFDEAAGGFVAEALVGSGNQCCCHSSIVRGRHGSNQAQWCRWTGSTT